MAEPEFSNHEQEEVESSEQDGMTIISHLEELRTRLIRAIVAVVIGSCICYFYAQELVHFITAPAGKLYYMNPAEAFFSYLQVSVFAGFLLGLPVVLYEVWAFVVPALTNREKTAVALLVPISFLLFIVGLSFSYFFVLPAGIKFLVGFATEDLQPMFSIGQYLSFVMSFLIPFGFIFEMPLAIMILAKVGILSSAILIKKRKVVIVLSFVIGAFIAPSPDIVSQCLVAIPTLLLYEISILIVKHLLRK